MDNSIRKGWIPWVVWEWTNRTSREMVEFWYNFSLNFWVKVVKPFWGNSGE